MSKGWSMKKQCEVYSKTNFKCAYCGKQLDFSYNGYGTIKYAIDHIIPKSKGGSNDTSNLLAACRSCNSSKKAKSLEWYRFIETLKRNKIPLFTEKQIEYLKTKIDIKSIFPEEIKFYFETL